jgi:type III secretory pathway lipoprotein EscJ
MNKIIFADCSMFTKVQKIYVLDNDTNEIKRFLFSTIEELPNRISIIANEDNIENVTIRGPKAYTIGIAKKINEKSLSKYNKKLKIDFSK